MKAVRALVVSCVVTVPAFGAGEVAPKTEAHRVEQQAVTAPEPPERHVIVMPVGGLWNHPFSEGGWKAKVGPVVGLDVKIEPFTWLGVRASFLRGYQPLTSGLDVKPLSSASPSAPMTSYQPMLKITQLGLRAEPTLRFSRAWSSYLGAGITWARVEVPEAVTSPRLRSLDRSGVHVGYEGALGLAYEPIVDWIVFDLSVVGALLGKQTGTAYDTVQAFSDDGRRTEVGGLSHFDGVIRLMFGVGLVL
ncbi:MAG TPA: hypothetical protein VIV60_28540 [Polyangiaceae bacterium]